MICSCGNEQHGERVKPSRIVTIIEKKPVVLLYQAGMEVSDKANPKCWFCVYPKVGDIVL